MTTAVAMPGLGPSGLTPDLGPGVRAWFSTREGGVSPPPFDSLNLGDHVGDQLAAVQHNRQLVEDLMGARAVWLRQVHGSRVVQLQGSGPTWPGLAPQVSGGLAIEADGAITAEPGVACAVMVADCLPVLLAAPQGRAVGALHAGWRGLAGAGPEMAGRGVVEQGVEALCELASCAPADLRVWLGPCIGPQAFEVGHVVLEAFGVTPSQDARRLPAFFKPCGAKAGTADVSSSEPKWLADLQGLAAHRLQSLGVMDVQVEQACTVSDRGRFFSFRRDGVTGRMVALITRDHIGA